MVLAAVGAAGLCFGPPGLVAQTSLGGRLGVEARFFPAEPLSLRQPRWFSTSAVARPELTIGLGDELTLRTIAIARVDQSDSERSYVDLREAVVQWDRGAVTVSAGVNTVFWGVTESRHLVDVINQTDYLADLGGDEKFGQLMGLVTYYGGELGTVDVFVMTWARPQLYPGQDGRPGVPLSVLVDSPVYDARRDEWNVDYALRWASGIGEWDWALSLYSGTAREPELVPVGAVGVPTLRPNYDLIRQAGLEAQWTGRAWLWKAEAIVRSGQGPSFAAVTGGFEHTRYGVFGGTLDLGTIVEYSYDGRDNLTYNLFDSDLFLGARLSLNDVNGTEVLVGVLQDTASGVTLGSVEASRRLGVGWRVVLDGRVFRADTEEDPVYWFRRDDYLQAVLEYRF